MAYDDYVGNDYVGDDFVGDDFVGDDGGQGEILGAVARKPVQIARRGAPMQRMQARPPQLSAQSRPPQKLRGYIGIGVARFNSTNGALATLVIEPQRQFRPERLIIARRDGSTVTNSIGTFVNAIYIGDQPQSPSVEQPAPTEMFQPDSTYSGVDFNTCLPGQKIQIMLSASSTPTGTEQIILSLGFYGDMMR